MAVRVRRIPVSHPGTSGHHYRLSRSAPAAAGAMVADADNAGPGGVLRCARVTG
jgi:hypothetical protein